MRLRDRIAWLKLLKHNKPVKLFITVIAVVISLAVMGIFVGIYYSNYNLIIETVKGQASSYFDLVVKAREWNAGHAGVYVEKKPGVETNQFLRMLGVEPDLQSSDGRIFTLRNPALMTKEISALTHIEDGTSFHITSDNPVNPDNSPDEFERSAIQSFRAGEKEAWEIDRSGPQPVFRYMGPLHITQSCLNCHYTSGYNIGDIRGGITVNIPFGRIDDHLKANRIRVALLFFVTLGLLLGTLYIMSSRLVNELSVTQLKLKEASITDELTGLKNRRFVMDRLWEEFQKSKRTGEKLGILIIDLDYFKRVNDTYGHMFGDVILRQFAQRVRKNLRAYDVFGRLGGEEFLVISSDLYPDGESGLGERIRNIVRSEKMGEGDTMLTITVSIGATEFRGSDDAPRAMLKRADDALYMAKDAGRDKVVEL